MLVLMINMLYKHVVNCIFLVQAFVASFVNLHFFSFLAMEVDSSAAGNQQMKFCGNCFQDCEGHSNFRGVTGRWQQYGDIRAGEKFYTYLCSGCSNCFWRLFTKGEEYHDNQARNEQYMAFLKIELDRKKLEFAKST